MMDAFQSPLQFRGMDNAITHLHSEVNRERIGNRQRGDGLPHNQRKRAAIITMLYQRRIITIEQHQYRTLPLSSDCKLSIIRFLVTTCLANTQLFVRFGEDDGQERAKERGERGRGDCHHCFVVVLEQQRHRVAA